MKLGTKLSVASTARNYIYSRADAERIIAEHVQKFGPNEAIHPLNYIGGEFGRKQAFSFVEHHQPFYKGKFRKLGSAS